MLTYIMLANYTQQGIQTVKEGPSRLDAAKQRLQTSGATLKAMYLTMGRYDLVYIVEAPDAETAATLALAGASGGAVRGETLRAFTEDEYRNIIASLP